MTFDFAAPTRILFGEGRLSECASIAAGYGTRALVMQGGGDRAATLVGQLRARGLHVMVQTMSGEPTATIVETISAEARREGCDVVVGMGGGSVVDAAKAVAALITNSGPVREYLEVVGRGRALSAPPVPFIAIPTTAGTGAEVTRNAVLLAEEEGVKVSLRSALMVPPVAILDPTLTHSLPPAATASTGLDALTQCIEPFVSPFATPLTDAVAREGIGRASRAIARAVRDGQDAGARRDMMLAALCSGIALANARLGAVHGFAAPLGGMFPIPHGVACARLLPTVTAVNVRALARRSLDASALARYAEVARILTGDSSAAADDAAAWLGRLIEEVQVPRLGRFEVRESDIPRIVKAARAASSMKGNPVVLTDDELAEALGAAI